MAQAKPTKFLLPGLFLLLLGFGNLVIGTQKQAEYEVVLTEIALEDPASDSAFTPLKRIQGVEQLTEKNYQRRKTAASRRDYYRFVAYGGKVMLGISLLLLFTAVVLKIGRTEGSAADSESEDEI